jgi:hypothetical protein
MQSLAMLDAILSPEWEYRYFSFNCRWAPGEQMGSMRNGCGDHYFALFNSAGCWLKGFDHEAPMTPFASDPPKVAPGLLDEVPIEFAACLSEPAFVVNETTFCIWRRYVDGRWQHGPIKLRDDEQDADGSAGLLRYLDGRPETYREWASDYYEQELAQEPIRSIFSHRPLDQQIVSQLNKALVLSALEADAQEIGYPAR